MGANVRHAYNTCIGGTIQTLTILYYVRKCPDGPDEVLTLIEQDVSTGIACDEPYTDPPSLSDLQ